MEQEPFGERPGSPEIKQENLEKLFCAYSDMAMRWGRAEDALYDPELEPGDDGTLDENRERTWARTITFRGQEVPRSLLSRDINQLEVTYQPSVMFNGELTDDEVFIEAQEGSGIIKYAAFNREENGTITPWSMLETEEAGASHQHEELSEEQKFEVVTKMAAGDDLTALSDAENEFAEWLYWRLEEYAPGISNEDVEMFKVALPELEAKLYG